MASAWGKAWGKSFGAAWGSVAQVQPPGSGSITGYPIRIPTPHRRRTRRQRERSDLLLIAHK